MIAPTVDLTALLRALGDPVRLRILGVLELEELSVGELTRALGLSQSRVSNHLRVLREHELLLERRVGTSTFLRTALSSAPGGADAPWAARLWSTLREGLPALAEHEADRARLGEVLAERRRESRDFFDRVAGEWDKRGASFATGQARQRAVASLLPRGLVLADLGCGTGYMARALGGLAGRLVCVDRSAGMLEEARARLAHLPSGVEVEFRAGELDDLPIATDELDGALAGMVLHHLPALDAPLREMRRAIRPGGTAVVLELAPHKEEWMHAELGDAHLGLDASDVVLAMRRAGFEHVHLEPVEDRYCPTPRGTDAAVALPLYIVRGRVPAATTSSHNQTQR